MESLKSNGFFLVAILLFSSCKQTLYDINYKGEENYKPFYVVDTITIDNPIRVYSQKYGGMFILSRSKLMDFKNEADFFLSPDVFLLGSDLYRDLALEDFKKFSYSDYGSCELKESESKLDGLEIYEFVKQLKFILGLINTNYYHVKHNSYTYFGFPAKNPKATYHKMVYPLCK